MKRFLVLILLLFLLIVNGFATHERAGEIVYRHIEGLTYEVTIITYTYAPSPADRCELGIKWGDGTASILPRNNGGPIQNCPHGGEIVAKDIKMNLYSGVHTYNGNGTFRLSVEDPNRNWGIVNIPYSVNVPFYIDTELVIQPLLGFNNSVQLLNPPLDYACIDRLYIHNPGAYDPDGDSLSYRLTICKGANGQVIPGYSYPEASNSFTIDEFTGDLIWDKPVLQGEYNVAFIVEEWRSGIRIGYVTRDLQILVDACNNDPPIIETISDTCVVAGDSISFLVSAHDPNGDMVSLSANGSPFLQIDTPAEFNPNPAIGDSVATAVFSWNTNCSHVLKEPHAMYIKAKDTFPNPPPGPPSISLSTYKNVKIKVIAPAIEIFEAIPIGTSIEIEWEKPNCANAMQYHIYRKDDSASYNPGYCETGVPAYTGYVKIADVNNITDTVFKDDNDGLGLIHGIKYCYIVTYGFPDGAESIASNQMCALLKKDLPIITNVSVEKTSFDQGEIYVAWSKPTELDTVLIPGPYQYRINRKVNSSGSDFMEIETYYNLNDTIFNDFNLSTRDFQYIYRIDLYHGDPASPEKVGSTVSAPSIYLNTFGTDQAIELSWNDDIPWKNEEFFIYRLKDPDQILEDTLVGVSNQPFFADTGLVNGKIYAYRVETRGRYASPGIIHPIINWSQFSSDQPVDNVPPCSPELTVTTNCDQLINELTWVYPDSCESERLQFYIYYSPSSSSDYSLYDSTGFIEAENSDEYYYNFGLTPPSVVGCFAITALDSIWNESEFSNFECIDIDECGLIWFPNVFTPNGDQWNQYFQADSVNSIENFEIIIFNRWGSVMYESNDPFFEWDGRDQNNNKDCSTGVYFYEARITHYTLAGPMEKKYQGSVTLLR